MMKFIFSKGVTADAVLRVIQNGDELRDQRWFHQK
jgi:hypothetical protein